MTRVLHIAWISNVDSAIYEFLNDLARRRVAVAQWFSEVRFLTKIQNFFLCPMLVTRQKDNFRYFLPELKIYYFTLWLVLQRTNVVHFNPIRLHMRQFSCLSILIGLHEQGRKGHLTNRSKIDLFMITINELKP